MFPNRLLLCILCCIGLLVGFSEKETPYSEKIFGQWVIGNQQFISTERGLLLLSKDGVGEYIFESWSDRVMDIAQEQQTVVAVTYNGVLYAITDSNQNKVVLPLQQTGLPYVLNGIVYKDKSWWISSLEGVVFEFDGTQVLRSFKLIDSKTKKLQNIGAMGIDNSNHLWVSSLNRVYFLTDLHKRRKNRLDFLASSEFEFESAQLFSNRNGVYVLAKDRTGRFSLSLGVLNASVMDAIKKEVNLPGELIKSQKLQACATIDALYLLQGNTLYTLKNLTWSKIELEQDPINLESFAILNNLLWVGSSSGLSKHPLLVQ